MKDFPQAHPTWVKVKSLYGVIHNGYHGEIMKVDVMYVEDMTKKNRNE